MKKLLVIWLTLWAFFFNHVAIARPAPGYDAFIAKTTGWTAATIGFSGEGRALVGAGIPVWSPSPGGGAAVNLAGKLGIGAGQASVALRGAATGAAIFNGAKWLMMSPGGLAINFGIMAAPTFIDWLHDGGVRPAQGPNAPGSPGNPDRKAFEMTDPSVCSVAPCFQYRAGVSGNWHSSPLAAAQDAIASMNATDTYFLWSVVSASHDGWVAARRFRSDGSALPDAPQGFAYRSASPASSSWIPATIEEIRKYMEGVPAGAPMIDFLLSGGATIEVTPTNISGDSSVSDPEKFVGNVIQSLPPIVTVTETPGGVTVMPGQIGSGYRDVRLGDGTFVKIPTTTTSSSTYNPATNTTTTTTTTTQPGGTVEQTKTSTTALTYTTTGGVSKVGAVTTTETKTVVKDEAGNVISTDTATDDTSKPPSEQQATCGLPNQPACKIDETGTPSDAQKPLLDARTKLDEAQSTAKDSIEKAALIEAPRWTFTFQLPTGCAAYVTGLRGVILNICQWQSTIHDLMSMVWAGSTFFCIAGMVGRTIRES